MCKTPFGATLGAPAAAERLMVASRASWTRPRDPRSRPDASRRPVSWWRRARSSQERSWQAAAPATGRSTRSASLRSSAQRWRSRQALRGVLPLPRLDRPGSAAVAALAALTALGGALDGVVDRRRPLVGVARARARLPRLPRARAPRRSARRRCAAGRRPHGARRRGRARLGAARRRRPLALPGRRPDRAAARARRLLERAGAARRRRRSRSVSGRPGIDGSRVRIAGLLARLRRRPRAAPHPVAGGGGRSGRRARAVARALRRAAGRRTPSRSWRGVPGSRRRRAGRSRGRRSSRTARCARTASPTGGSSRRSPSPGRSSSPSRMAPPGPAARRRARAGRFARRSSPSASWR